MRLSKIITIALVFLIMILLIVNFLALTTDSFTEKGNLTMVVTGDVMICSQVTPTLSNVNTVFDGIKDQLGTCDLLLINFEGTMTSSNSNIKPDYPYKVDPSYVSKIKINNNTVAALANNHIGDYGQKGLSDTISNLKSNKITTLGAGSNVDEASQPVVFEKNGHKITILNFMDAENFAEYPQSQLPKATSSQAGYNPYNSTLAQKQIKEAQDNGSDFIVVFFHYGNEYHTSPNTNQVNFSHEVIDYGADAVVGSHPHVAQGIEMYSGKPIFYSLGNLVFYPLGDSNSYYGYFVQFDLTGDNCTATVYPIVIKNNFPVHMGASSGSSFLSGLSPLTKSLKINSDGTGTIVFNLTDEE